MGRHYDLDGAGRDLNIAEVKQKLISVLMLFLQFHDSGDKGSRYKY